MSGAGRFAGLRRRLFFPAALALLALVFWLLLPGNHGHRATLMAEVTAVEEGRLIVRPLQTPLQKPGAEALSLDIPKEAADIAPGTILEIEYDGRILPAAQGGPAALGQVYSIIPKTTE